MKNGIILFWALLLCHLANSQTWYNDPTSYSGVIVLTDRSTERGEFIYNQLEEELRFDNGKQIKSNEAKYFQFYDPQMKDNRHFFLYQDEKGFFRFYELLLNGKISVYQKKILVEKSYVDSDKNTTTIFMDKKTINSQLYIIDKNQAVLIEDFETQILTLMKDKIREISTYIISKQFDITTMENQLLIVDYYNRLFAVGKEMTLEN